MIKKFFSFVYDYFEYIFGFLLVIIIFFGFIYVYGIVENDKIIKLEIIKNSDEYTKYNTCVLIDNIYYCK